MIGDRFGFLTVIRKTNERLRRNVVWICQCDCGKEISVIKYSLTAGEKKSCGCKTKAETSGTHGMSGTPTHNTWRTMIERCTKPYHKSYDRYKDVPVDPKWFEFEGFYSDMGVRPKGMTLDRINGKLGYTKSNCRWATLSTQQQNKPPSERNKHGFPGVFESNGKYCSRIRYGGKRHYLGTFDSPEDAHLVYDKRGREIFEDEWVSYFKEDRNDDQS